MNPLRRARGPATSAVRQDLRSILGDGIAFSVMVGIGETYLAAFVLALGMAEVTAGLVSSVPLLAGALLQLVTPLGVRKVGSHRRWVVLCVGVQAASFLPLVAAALLGRFPAGAVFLVAALYWGAGMASGPAWNAWVGALVPERVRARYWAHRGRFAHAAVFAGLLAGGVVLHRFATPDRPLSPFALLFGIAAICRAISALFLARQREPRKFDPPQNVPALEFLRRFRHDESGRFLLFVLAAQAAVQIASPFFTPFMLRQLHLPYRDFMMVLAISYIAKMLSLPLLGRLAQRYGSRRLLLAGAIGIVPLPALWLLSPAVPFLFAVNFFSGLAWAAYELSVFLLLFETIRTDERTSLLTTFNLANALATLGGAATGGILLHTLGETPRSYAILFAISFAARAATLLLLRRCPGVAFRVVPILWRTLSVVPSAGSLARPILASLPRPTRLERRPRPPIRANGTPADPPGPRASSRRGDAESRDPESGPEPSPCVRSS